MPFPQIFFMHIYPLQKKKKKFAKQSQNTKWKDSKHVA